jgi:CBS domain containing-hemolysin-like protein
LAVSQRSDNVTVQELFFIDMDDYHLYLFVPFAIIALILLIPLFRYKKRASTRIEPLHAESDDHHDAELPSSSLKDEEQELIRGMKEFQGGIVREVMVPRIDVVAVDETADLETLRQLALEKGHSRIPVYRGSIDHITGIAYVKDMLRYWRTEDESITVADFMRSPYFVPETKNIGQLLHEFQAQKVHIAVAIDEYGGTAGIVSIEDLLEVVFGDIVDEHDAEENLIKAINDTTWEVNAKVDIDELEDYVGELHIEQQDFETVGGLLFAILGEIPQPGDEVTYQHLKFTVLHADKHRIVTVRVEQANQATAEIVSQEG